MKKLFTYLLVFLMSINSYAGQGLSNQQGGRYSEDIPILNKEHIENRSLPIGAYQIDDKIVILEAKGATYTGSVSDCSKFGPASISTQGEPGLSPSVCWVVDTWSECSATCGTGTRDRDVKCIDLDGNPSIMCQEELKPEANVECSDYASCGYSWNNSDWEQCAEACGPSSQIRNVWCERDDGTTVADNYCDETSKPSSNNPCTNYSSCTYEWESGTWTNCSSTCGNGSQSRENYCLRNDGNYVALSNCNPLNEPNTSQSCTDTSSCLYGWTAGEWNTCSESCGTGTQTRSIECERSDGTIVEDSWCAAAKPESSQSCSDTSSCTYAWVSEDWSACSTTCGTGTQVRTVTCQRSDGVTVPDASCIEAKPAANQACTNTTSCSYSWNYSSWGSCSTTCGSGTQTRTATCLRSDGATVANNFCTAAAVLSQPCTATTGCSYAWESLSWGSCSTTCGTGTQARTVQCKRSDGTIVVDASCTAAKPATNQSCTNTSTCTYSWNTTSWGACSTTCGTGTQGRTVTCQRSDGVTVPDASCTSAKPVASQACTVTTSCSYDWNYSSWGSCSTTCGTGTQTRTATCLRSDGTTVANSFCTVASVLSQPCTVTTGCSYAWESLSWGACSTTCGTGTQNRTVQCKRSDGTVVADASCTAAKPATSQSCTGTSTCTYAWITSAYGSCSTTCGTGTQSRTVTCQRSDGVNVTDSYCTTTKPVASRACTVITSCTYAWNYTTYGACSTTCGTGTQTRTATCQRSDGTTVANSYCTTAPILSRSCTVTTSCTYSWIYNSWGSCSTTCGTGTQTRTATCRRSDGTTVANSNCTATPILSQSCTASTGCVVSYSWVYGSWSTCYADECGYADGWQTRSATCKRNDGVTMPSSYCTGTPVTGRGC